MDLCLKVIKNKLITFALKSFYQQNKKKINRILIYCDNK